MRLFIGLAALAALASQAFAGPTLHYFTQDTTLYRWDGTTVSSKSITGGGTGAAFPALAFNPFTGKLWGFNSSSVGADRGFYEIDLNTGAAVKKIDVVNSISVISFDFRNNAGTPEVFGMADANLGRYNATTGAFLGSQAQGVSGGFPATAFDSGSGTYYGASNSGNDLYKLNFGGSATKIADIKEGGNNLTWNLAGGAWAAGQMYMGVRQNNNVRLGTLNVITGAWTQITNAAFTLSSAGAMGYAVLIPAPAAALLAVMGLGAIGALKRRFN